jgi:hypothetical protein
MHLERRPGIGFSPENKASDQLFVAINKGPSKAETTEWANHKMAAFYQRNGGEQIISNLHSFSKNHIIVFLQQQDALTRSPFAWSPLGFPSGFENTVGPVAKQPPKVRLHYGNKRSASLPTGRENPK